MNLKSWKISTMGTITPNILPAGPPRRVNRVVVFPDRRQGQQLHTPQLLIPAVLECVQVATLDRYKCKIFRVVRLNRAVPKAYLRLKILFQN